MVNNYKHNFQAITAKSSGLSHSIILGEYVVIAGNAAKTKK